MTTTDSKAAKHIRRLHRVELIPFTPHDILSPLYELDCDEVARLELVGVEVLPTDVGDSWGQYNALVRCQGELYLAAIY